MSEQLANEAYRLQLDQYKVELNQQQLYSQVIADTCSGSRALLAEIKTLQALLASRKASA